MKSINNIVFTLIILLILISSCSYNITIPKFEGKEVKSNRYNIDTNNKYINFDNIETYITPKFSAILMPYETIYYYNIPFEDYYMLDLLFTGNKDTISITRILDTYRSLFETDDFYYLPLEIDGTTGSSEEKPLIYKLGVLVIYKESLKYDTLSFINEGFVSIKQENNKLIVKTNKLYVRQDPLYFLLEISNHCCKYDLVESDEYKEYIFIK